MARSPRDRFETERSRLGAIDDPDTRSALLAFADAIDPEVVHVDVPAVKDGRIVGRKEFSNSTCENYPAYLRRAHERGLDLLGADVETVNDFMADLVTDADDRRHGLVDHKGSISKVTASCWQAALRTFYRFCAEPETRDERPGVRVPWDAVDGSHRLRMYAARPEPSVGEDEMPGQAELDAMREACLSGQNTRRDRAFLETAAGTGQRVYAIVTLRVGDVYLDGTDDVPFPHVYLNPAIKNDGDKGAIERAGGRLRPFVADHRPVREWLDNHPLADADTREDLGGPDAFEDCYLFIGSLRQYHTLATSHWSGSGARKMLDRRKTDTASLPTVETVTGPVNPHAWRGYAYTRSKGLPVDEADRRRMFGWSPGSDEGERSYDHTELAQAAGRIAEAWADTFDGTDSAAASIAEQVVGATSTVDLSAAEREAIVADLLADGRLVDELAAELDGG